MAKIAIPLLLTAIAASAQPFIFQRGVMNAASFMAPGLPASAIAQGSIFSIFGRSLGPANGVGGSFPIATSLGGVSIEVCTGAALRNCVAGLPLYVSGSQVNAIMPSNAPLGSVSIRVSNGGATSNWSPVEVIEASVGIFTVNSGGFGPAIVQNYISATQVPLNSLGNSAQPGQTLIVYATGLGSSGSPDNLPAPGGSLGSGVEVFLGERAARVDYAGRAPGFAGLDQLNVVVPNDVPVGCYVPLRVRTRGQIVSNTVSIAVSANGGRCADEHNPVSGPISLGQKFFGFLAHRVESSADVDPEEVTSYTSEWAAGFSAQPAASEFAYHLLSIPPKGTCSGLALRSAALTGTLRLPFAPYPAMDLGPSVALAAAGKSLTLPKATSLAQYYSQFSAALSTAADFVFGSGSLSLSGNVTGSVPTETPLLWTNRANLRRIVRGEALTVEWSGGRSGAETVVVAGLAESLANNAGYAFLCAVEPSAGRFTVPSHVLANLPLSRKKLWELPAMLFVGRVPAQARSLSVNGVDLALGGFANWLANTVQVEAAK